MLQHVLASRLQIHEDLSKTQVSSEEDIAVNPFPFHCRTVLTRRQQSSSGFSCNFCNQHLRSDRASWSGARVALLRFMCS
jgi:hypothetical protein